MTDDRQHSLDALFAELEAAVEERDRSASFKPEAYERVGAAIQALREFYTKPRETK